MTGEFTGRHMAALIVGGFGIVIAVNLAMAVLASSTFGGVVVENSYAASQEFNSWLDAAERDQGLGWDIGVTRNDAGRLVVSTANVPAGAVVSGVARHPLGVEADRVLDFEDVAGERFISRQRLPGGRWTLRLVVTAGGKNWRGERQLQ